MNDLILQCQCKAVKGKVHGIAPSSGNRLVCYCGSCQKFANYLHSDVLNTHGGSDVFQIAPSFLSIEEGVEHIKSLKLTDKGVCRWYAGCCNTPIGNTVNSKVPMVGILQSFIAKNQNIDEIIGVPLGNVFVKQLGTPLPSDLRGQLSEKRVVFRMIRKILAWKIMGWGAPNLFYDALGKPIVKPHRV
ncbi:DUF6151 family protein [Marinomonas sp. 2405UD68-3]|uniref:DUF6151 family protein n=1 Tax=Marinomonas sp. 2405UD68-3 TaxID=3391835 RepID=UPI0039C92483